MICSSVHGKASLCDMIRVVIRVVMWYSYHGFSFCRHAKEVLHYGNKVDNVRQPQAQGSILTICNKTMFKINFNLVKSNCPGVPKPLIYQTRWCVQYLSNVIHKTITSVISICAIAIYINQNFDRLCIYIIHVFLITLTIVVCEKCY